MNSAVVDAPRPTGPTEVPSLAEVYRVHAPAVARWATRLSGRPQETSDLVQDVFLVVQRRLPSFRPERASLTTWLFLITENVVRNHRRRVRLRGWLFGERQPAVERADEGRTPAEHLEWQRDVRRTYEVLDRLGESDRTLLVLFELDGYSGKETAELMGIKPETIWVRLHRARQRFHGHLVALEPELLR